MEKIFKTEIAGRSLVVETGKILYSNGSVFIKYGDTTVLSTVTASSEPRGVLISSRFQLITKKMYAVGKIPEVSSREREDPERRQYLLQELSTVLSVRCSLRISGTTSV